MDGLPTESSLVVVLGPPAIAALIGAFIWHVTKGKHKPDPPSSDSPANGQAP